MLAPTKEKVLETHGKLKGKLENLEPQLRKASGFAFYNTSKYDFEKLLDDPPSLATNLRSYLNGFSENMREVLDKFDFLSTIAKLEKHGLLFLVMEKSTSNVVDLHPNKDADNIKFGSTLSNWQLGARSYDYQCANPPYGKEWKLDQTAVEAEAERGHAGRFGAGLPRISDGQLLFLQHTLSRMKEPQDGGGRVAIVMNGSPLFTGDAGEHCRMFDSTEFGYRRITVERPLRLNFQVNAERLTRLEQESGFQYLAVSKRKESKAKAAEEAEGRKQQAAILKALGTLPDKLCKDRAKFIPLVDDALKRAGLKVGAPVRKTILCALSERDESAEICRHDDGQPEPDPELRDTENVPLTQDINDYFDREVKPHVPDAWINTSIRNHKEGEVGKVGYEINFNRYFYRYQPPRPLGEIEADIKTLESEIMPMLRDVAG